MENKLQYSSLLENKHWKPFYFTGISSDRNTRNDGLSMLFDRFVSGGSKDALFTPFRGTFHKIQSPISGLDPAKKDIVTGILMATFFMKGFVSAVTAMVDAPLQRVKLLLQNQGELIKSGRLSRPYRGITDCLVRTIKKEGVISLWRGNSVYLIKILPYMRQKRSSEPLNWAIVSAYVVNYPFVAVSNRMMMTSGEAFKYKSSIDTFPHILKNEGIHSLYKGFGASLVCLIPGYLLVEWYRKMEKRNKRPFGCISVVIERK